MSKDAVMIQPHNQVLWDDYAELGAVRLGPYSSYTWRHDPKHVLFTLARYKFSAKLLQGRKSALEIGCGDAIGAPILLQSVHRLHCVDLETLVIEDNILRNEHPDRLTFQAADVTRASLAGAYDAAVCLDVIEHIDEQDEAGFMAAIHAALAPGAALVLGTPNITSQVYASPNSREGHINLKSAQTLGDTLNRWFEQHFIFSMNDEVVHTGYFPMAHYLMGLGINPRNKG